MHRAARRTAAAHGLDGLTLVRSLRLEPEVTREGRYGTRAAQASRTAADRCPESRPRPQRPARMPATCLTSGNPDAYSLTTHVGAARDAPRRHERFRRGAIACRGGISGCTRLRGTVHTVPLFSFWVRLGLSRTADTLDGGPSV